LFQWLKDPVQSYTIDLQLDLFKHLLKIQELILLDKSIFAFFQTNLSLYIFTISPKIIPQGVFIYNRNLSYLSNLLWSSLFLFRIKGLFHSISEREKEFTEENWFSNLFFSKNSPNVSIRRGNSETPWQLINAFYLKRGLMCHCRISKDHIHWLSLKNFKLVHGSQLKFSITIFFYFSFINSSSLTPLEVSSKPKDIENSKKKRERERENTDKFEFLLERRKGYFSKLWGLEMRD